MGNPLGTEAVSLDLSNPKYALLRKVMDVLKNFGIQHCVVGEFAQMVARESSPREFNSRISIRVNFPEGLVPLLFSPLIVEANPLKNEAGSLLVDLVPEGFVQIPDPNYLVWKQVTGEQYVYVQLMTDGKQAKINNVSYTSNLYEVPFQSKIGTDGFVVRFSNVQGTSYTAEVGSLSPHYTPQNFRDGEPIPLCDYIRGSFDYIDDLYRLAITSFQYDIRIKPEYIKNLCDFFSQNLKVSYDFIREILKAFLNSTDKAYLYQQLKKNGLLDVMMGSCSEPKEGSMFVYQGTTYFSPPNFCKELSHYLMQCWLEEIIDRAITSAEEAVNSSAKEVMDELIAEEVTDSVAKEVMSELIKEEIGNAAEEAIRMIAEERKLRAKAKAEAMFAKGASDDLVTVENSAQPTAAEEPYKGAPTSKKEVRALSLSRQEKRHAARVVDAEATAAANEWLGSADQVFPGSSWDSGWDEFSKDMVMITLLCRVVSYIKNIPANRLHCSGKPSKDSGPAEESTDPLAESPKQTRGGVSMFRGKNKGAMQVRAKILPSSVTFFTLLALLVGLANTPQLPFKLYR